MFVHGAYGWKLVVANLHNTAGQNGYVQQGQNMYNIFEKSDDLSNATTTVTHTPAAATTGSTLGNIHHSALASTPQELTTAINTIAVNQQSLYQHIGPLLLQMAALSFTQQTTQMRPPVFQAPPIQHFAIPGPPAYGGNQGGYQQGFQQGHDGGCSTGRRCNTRCNNNRRGRGRTPFDDHMAAQGCGYICGTCAFPPASGGTQQPFQSNLIKQLNNWNVCYSCGFDVEADHDLMMCPHDWRKPSHDVNFTRDNAQTYLAMGLEAYTRGMHKTMLPRNL